MSFANARTLEKTSRSSRTWALDTTRLVQLVLLAGWLAINQLFNIVCSTKNSLAASHDKSEVCLSTRCEMNY
jgi:hypothetical protein